LPFHSSKERVTHNGPSGELWHMTSTRDVTFDPALAEGISVWSAGGLIWRRNDDGVIEVVVCYRPYRVDWSFPKGKLESGESFEDAAVREVHEETGLVCSRGAYVGFVTYIDRKDRPKVVVYWLMQAIGGEFLPNDEVSELRWVDVETAKGLVTYDRDRDVLAMFAEMDEVRPLR